MQAQRSQDGVALVGATLIDGTGGPPLADAAVLVRRGKVESIGPRSGFELPRGINQVDVSGRWIIPGLIDAHAHLAQAAGWAPARYLAWGVTTVRDMHGPLNSVISVRRRSNTQSSGSPRVYAAGAMIDGLPTTYPDAIGVNSEQDARKAVDRLVSAGVDFIKVYTHIDPPLLRAILDEAHTFNVARCGPPGYDRCPHGGKGRHLVDRASYRRARGNFSGRARLCWRRTIAGFSPAGPHSSDAGPISTRRPSPSWPDAWLRNG